MNILWFDQALKCIRQQKQQQRQQQAAMGFSKVSITKIFYYLQSKDSNCCKYTLKNIIILKETNTFMTKKNNTYLINTDSLFYGK